MAFDGKERRSHPRVKGRFVVSYRVFEEADNVDISQTKDISLGGMFITTNRKFEPGTKLTLEMRLPFDPDTIRIVGKVIESREVAANLIYDTRIQFLGVDDKHKDIVKQTIDYFMKKGTSR